MKLGQHTIAYCHEDRFRNQNMRNIYISLHTNLPLTLGLYQAGTLPDKTVKVL